MAYNNHMYNTNNPGGHFVPQDRPRYPGDIGDQAPGWTTNDQIYGPNECRGPHPGCLMHPHHQHHHHHHHHQQQQPHHVDSTYQGSTNFVPLSQLRPIYPGMGNDTPQAHGGSHVAHVPQQQTPNYCYPAVGHYAPPSRQRPRYPGIDHVEPPPSGYVQQGPHGAPHHDYRQQPDNYPAFNSYAHPEW